MQLKIPAYLSCQYRPNLDLKIVAILFFCRGLTKAELAYKKRRLAIEKDRIKNRATKSHKDKVKLS